MAEPPVLADDLLRAIAGDALPRDSEVDRTLAFTQG
jgi:hypothetical protein